MKKLIAVVLSLTMVAVVVPVSASAARQQETGTIQVAARDAAQQPLAGHVVQLRDLKTGQLAATGTTDSAGRFSFVGIPHGNYVVELVSPGGAIVGTSAPIAVAAGTATTVTVVATAGEVPGGFSLFGLGKAASISVLGAAAVVGVTAAVVAAKDDASPSR